MDLQADHSHLGNGIIESGLIHGLVAVDRQLHAAPLTAYHVLIPVIATNDFASFLFGRTGQQFVSPFVVQAAPPVISQVRLVEQKYLRNQRELGFAQLQSELANPNVDALLFQRQKAQQHDRDKWVAVLNLQQTETRSFWNQAHELSHRIAEPPQGLLPFKRHRVDRSEPIERLMDLIAAEMAFFPDVFVPLVEDRQGTALTFERVQSLQSVFAETSSLLAATNAVVNAWPQPAVSLTAKFEGRKRNPHQDVTLRGFPQARNAAARYADELFVISRVRVPETSIVYEAYRSGMPQAAVENLATWSTSGGRKLKDTNVLISATPGFQESMYVLIFCE